MGKEVAVKQRKGKLVEAMVKDGPEDLLRVNDAGEIERRSYVLKSVV